MRRELEALRDDPFTFTLSGEARRVDLAAPHLVAWMRGVLASGRIVTVVVEGPKDVPTFVFTPRLT